MNQSGCRMLIAAPSFKTSDYVAMIDEVRPKLATLERTVFLGSDDWDALLTAGDSVPVDRLVKRMAGSGVRPCGQHPVHERHDGVPEGRHAQPPQHPQQRLFRRGGVRLHRA